MRLLALVLAALALAGCTQEPPGDADGGRGGAAALEAPWWNLGESWTIRIERDGEAARSSTLVNFANHTFGDPPHFWLGTRERPEALDHVFFDDNPFLGRIHWEILAPHEKGMHSALYAWPLEEGRTWTSPILLGREDVLLEASRATDGTMRVTGEARADGARFAYDYDPAVRWFRELHVTEADGTTALRATVTDHQDSGARGTFYFLRGRDYLDADGGSTGEREGFTVAEEGATSIAFLLNVRTSGPASIEFVSPSGAVVHRETLPLGGAADKIVEIQQRPAAGEWSLRYVGSVQGTILVRGIIDYKATL